jgi:hypothetical protein
MIETNIFFSLPDQVNKSKSFKSLEPIRDLLLISHPNIVDKGKCWKGHYTNRELCCMQFFWDNVFDTVNFLASSAKIHPENTVDKIALNLEFGRHKILWIIEQLIVMAMLILNYLRKQLRFLKDLSLCLKVVPIVQRVQIFISLTNVTRLPRRKLYQS